MTLKSERIEGPDDPADLFTHMVGLGITDGLPVIAPTEALVQAMIDDANNGQRSISCEDYTPFVFDDQHQQ
ncbi:MAG: hypothetical protein ACI8W7_004831 [Gammaproteobacteria bacterium]|jgi:hypothetical protein